MKWKIYFWIYLIICCLGLIALIPLLSKPTFELFEGAVENIILVLALWSYTYSKKVFKPMIWKIMFTVIVVDWALQLVVILTKVPFLNFFHSDFALDAIIFSIVFSIPCMIAMYRLGKGHFLKVGQSK
jgi:hypothetical protein